MESTETQYLQKRIEDLKRAYASTRQEIMELEAVHRGQKIEIEALEQALKTHLPPSTVSPQGNGSVVTSEPKGDFHKLGFRDAVRQILAESHKGLKPKDIADELLQRDFPYSGSVHIGTRVSNELHRMRKSNTVRKRGSLYYAQKGESP